jgi:hypothetical protein
MGNSTDRGPDMIGESTVRQADIVLEKKSRTRSQLPYDFSLMMTDPLAHRYGKNR